MTYWEAYGEVRGSCGHKHKSEAAAVKCAERDKRAIARTNASGSLTRSYSDREARLVTED